MYFLACLWESGYVRGLIQVPAEYNYIAAFLTLSCNYKCSYCINHPGDAACQPRTLLRAEDWTGYLNRLNLSDDLPVSLQGGEPSLHPEFFKILSGLRFGLRVDLLTNLSFDVEKLTREIPPSLFLRTSPYPSIRVTYHPGQSDLEVLFEKITFLQARGYPIGLYMIRMPGTERLIEKVRARAEILGIDFRTKEYLGFFRGKTWGTYQYEDGVFSTELKRCNCRTSELLIAPDGAVYKCHRDLYLGELSIGHILSSKNGSEYHPEYAFRSCEKFGECNPCDLKKKTNRFQVFGHASVEVQLEPRS